MGRRKDMEYIQSKKTRSRTFTNRKHGILKKASELAMLSNVDVGVIILGDKPYLWPQEPHQLNRILQRYESTSQEERQKRASNLKHTQNCDIGIDHLSEQQLLELMSCLDSKLQVVNERIHNVVNNNYRSSVITLQSRVSEEEQETNMDPNFDYNFEYNQQYVCDENAEVMMQMYGDNYWNTMNADMPEYTGLLEMGFGVPEIDQSYRHLGMISDNGNAPFVSSYLPFIQQPRLL